MTVVCPFCHQTIGTIRLGVRLTPLKAAIVDKIKAAGDIGIASEELMYALWDRDAVCVDTVKAHVWQINSLLELDRLDHSI
jgi:hypothetical protein